MEGVQSNGGNSEDGSEIEIAEKQSTHLKELGSQFVDMKLGDKLKRMERWFEEHEKTLESHTIRLRESRAAKSMRWKRK